MNSAIVRKGGNPDPNSKRRKRLNGPPGRQPKGKPPPPPGKAPGLQVKEIPYPSIISEKIYVLDGSNLRIVRDGLGLCPP